MPTLNANMTTIAYAQRNKTDALTLNAYAQRKKPDAECNNTDTE